MNPKQFSLEELTSKLIKINQMGFVKSKRAGNTGIGYTLEELLEIPENNFALSDFGIFELKSSRVDVKSLITLFTKSPRRLNNASWKDIIESHGYTDKEGRQAIKLTIGHQQENNQGWKLDIEDGKLFFKKNGVKICYYEKKDLEGIISDKIHNLVYVQADRDKLADGEHFHYKKAFLLTNPSYESFLNCIRNNSITIDLRMHLKPTGSVRDHGTAFRAFERNLSDLFENSKELF